MSSSGAGAGAGAGAGGAAVSAADLLSDEVTPKMVEAFQATFEADPKLRMAQNALTRNALDAVALDRGVVAASNHVYSTKIEKEGKATNQRASGRCWLFASCNVMRNAMIRKYNLPTDFELSQTYLFFWDKLERAGYFLNAIIETAAEPVDGRLVSHLLSAPMNDGGQFDMIVSIVMRHGVCPKSVYDDAHSAKASRGMNWMLTNKLRQFAKELRTMVASGASKQELQAQKVAQLSIIYSILAVSLGSPPTKFDWTYYDKDGKYQCMRDLTPMSFYNDVVPTNIEEYVSVINDPRNEYGKTYTVQYLGNVVGAAPVLYVNAPMDTLKTLVTDTIKGGEPVWFGVDVGKRFWRSGGMLDMHVFDYESVYGTKPEMSKADRLVYGESLMTHAMTFTAFDTDADGNLTKLRVENSWGDNSGDKGYLSMTSEWADNFLYQIVVKKASLPDDLRTALDTLEPKVLPAWDPMGALARL